MVRSIPIRTQAEIVLFICWGIWIDCVQAILKSLSELRRVEQRKARMNDLKEDLDKVESKAVESVSNS